jgi:glycosyltransferase involved in cell wall biosynthesis
MIHERDFKEYILSRNDKRITTLPTATVVVVIYNIAEGVLELMNSLQKQSFPSFEIVIINNGKIEAKVVDRIKAEPILYIESSWNSVSLGRNIGTACARGDIVIFLDDDCIAHKDLMRSHVLSYGKPEILGVQGKSLPKRFPFYYHFQSHYDLGNTVSPMAVIGLEGNVSLRKSVLTEVGGFDPELFGAEGLELSYRIAKKYKQPKGLIYNPEAIIYHDFAQGLFDYLEKCYRHTKMRNKIKQQYPDIISFAKEFGQYPRSKHNFSSFLEKGAFKLVQLLGISVEQFAKYFGR